MQSYSFIPKSWIYFAQILGTFLAVIGLGSYLYWISTDSLANYMEPVELAVTLQAVIAAVLSYMVWKTIYVCVVIVRFVRQANDVEISNNRFILSALSLNLGGFLTPFILTRMPNINTNSTINPRWYLSKVMGITTLVGGIIGFTSFAAVLMGSEHTQNGMINGMGMFDFANNSQVAWIILGSIISLSLIMLFGLLTTGMFYGTRVDQQAFENDQTKLNTGLKVISYIWMAIITIELMLVIFMSIVRMIAALADFMRKTSDAKGGLGFLIVLMALTGLVLTALRTYWVIKMTVETMVGIWKPNGIQYKEYVVLSEREKIAKNGQALPGHQ